jgi:hypothetical protein
LRNVWKYRASHRLNDAQTGQWSDVAARIREVNGSIDFLAVGINFFN